MMNKDRVHQNNQQEIQAILDFKAGICHDIRVHHDVFPSISVISQLAIQRGDALFSVNCHDTQSCDEIVFYLN